MASHNISRPVRSQSGFTLIEIVVVIAILGMILVFGLITTMDSFKRSTLQAEQSTLVSALEKARSRSMNNIGTDGINGSRWGVCYDKSNPSKPNYIIFRIDSSANVVNEETIEANPSVTIDPIPPVFICSSGPGIIFAQLSGKTASIPTINMTDGVKSVPITINNEGTINW